MTTKSIPIVEGELHRTLRIALEGGTIKRGEYVSRSKIGMILVSFENKGSFYDVSESVVVRGHQIGEEKYSSDNLKFE